MVEHQYLFCTMFVLQLIVQDMFFLKITADSLSQPHVEMHMYMWLCICVVTCIMILMLYT